MGQLRLPRPRPCAAQVGLGLEQALNKPDHGVLCLLHWGVLGLSGQHLDLLGLILCRSASLRLHSALWPGPRLPVQAGSWAADVSVHTLALPPGHHKPTKCLLGDHCSDVPMKPSSSACCSRKTLNPQPRPQMRSAARASARALRLDNSSSHLVESVSTSCRRGAEGRVAVACLPPHRQGPVAVAHQSGGRPGPQRPLVSTPTALAGQAGAEALVVQQWVCWALLVEQCLCRFHGGQVAVTWARSCREVCLCEKRGCRVA